MSACGGGTGITELAGPDATRCLPSVSGVPSEVPESGRQATLTVSAARECSWTVASDVPWVSARPTSGQGDGTVTLTIQENPVPQSRTGTVQVNGFTARLVQRESPCKFTVQGFPAPMSHASGRLTVDVATADSCRWDASSSAPWVRPTDTSLSGPRTAEFIVDANPGGERTATLVVAGHRLPFTQHAVPSASPLPPAPTPPAPSPRPPASPPQPAPPAVPGPPAAPAPPAAPRPPAPGPAKPDQDDDKGKDEKGGKDKDKDKDKDDDDEDEDDDDEDDDERNGKNGRDGRGDRDLLALGIPGTLSSLK